MTARFMKLWHNGNNNKQWQWLNFHSQRKSFSRVKIVSDNVTLYLNGIRLDLAIQRPLKWNYGD